MSGDFWENLLHTGYVGPEELDTVGHYLTSSEKENKIRVERIEEQVEGRLKGKALGEEPFESVRGLTESYREANALTLPVTAGTKVQFVTNLGSLMSYEDPPDPNAVGVVVNVKSAMGDVTSYEGMVFVEWEDRNVIPIRVDHLRLAKGSTRRGDRNVIRISSLGDLTDFMRVTDSDDTLVHKATKDLWSLKREGDEYVIERLFDDTGAPLKA